jgi:iron(III) transport system permease protein
VAAGVALALMETLADFGVASYFGIQTFTTGIYKAWLSMDNRLAAAQLATMLLVVVLACCCGWSTAPQRRMRFAAGGGPRGLATEAQPLVLRGGLRAGGLGRVRLPVLMGFVAPVAFMLRPLAADWSVLPWDRFVEWAWQQRAPGRHHRRAGRAVALALAFAVRRRPTR